MTTIAILLFEGVEELDFAGPWEVFRVAQGEDPTFDVYTVAEHLEPIRCANGLRVLADRTLADAGRPDVILVPGGQGTRNPGPGDRAVDRRGRPHDAVDDQRLHRLVPARRRRRHRRQARSPRTTPRSTSLAARDDTGEVLAGERWVHDGKVVTAAGVSAGIDMSLWLLGELRSPEFSRLVRDGIEYDPAPPY